VRKLLVFEIFEMEKGVEGGGWRWEAGGSDTRL
jgi:hypothetical protein